MTNGKGRGKEPSYGQAAERLEQILVRIEEGQVDIDELSDLVAEAARLVTLCRSKIANAEARVKTITEQLEREAPSPGDGEDEEGTGGTDLPEDVRY